MILRVAVATAFLTFLALFWRVLDIEANPLDGWVYSAYAAAFTILAVYRAGLAARERQALRAAPRAARGERPWVQSLDLLGFAALPMGLMLATLYAVPEKTMGMLQRIFYVHVPSAWVAFIAFGVVAVASVVHLARRSAAADRVAHASAEVGVVFTTIAVVTGPLWAKPAWGIWWTWDARLTLTLVLWLIYLGYLLLRLYIPDPERQARLAAVTGILGAVGVPIDYMAIRWWRTQHPQPVIGGGEGSGLHPTMLRAVLFMFGVFLVQYLALVLRRAETARLESQRDQGSGGPTSA